jgi:hypothetical protein
LLPIRQADDAEPPRTKLHAGAPKVPLFVWAAVNNCLRHLFDDAVRYVPVSSQIYDARDAAHVGPPLVQSLPSNQLLFPTVIRNSRGDLVRRTVSETAMSGPFFSEIECGDYVLNWFVASSKSLQGTREY